MPSSQAPNLGIYHSWDLGESGWDVQMNTNLKLFDALILLSVKSAVIADPPGVPVAGDRYIVAATATGAWVGQEGNIALWDGTAWIFFTPKEGWSCRAEDSKQIYVYDTAAWVLEGSLYGSYADDAAAAVGTVPVSGTYIKTATGAITIRLV